MGKPGSWSSFCWQLERKRKYYMSSGGSRNGGRRSRAGSTMATIIVFLLCFLLYLNLWTTANKESDVSGPSGNNNNFGKIYISNELEERPITPSSKSIKVKKNGIVQNSNSNLNEMEESGEFPGEAKLIHPRIRIPEKRLVPPSNSRLNSDLINGNDDNVEVDVENIDLENASAFAVSGDIDEHGKFKGSYSDNGKKSVGSGTRNGNESKDPILTRLKRNFYKADKNHDGFLTSPEISKWINEEIKAHFVSALKENFDAFFRIDKNPRNGRVEWREYLDFHLKEMGYKGPEITPEVLRSKEGFMKLPKHIKVEVAALEARWSENANNNPDFLTVDEFLAFTHPEASPTKLLSAVQDTFATFDLDGDGTITKTEFDTTYAEAEGVDNVYKEDLQFIDTNKDEQISRVELMRYMDPKNTLHSDKDTAKLLKEADINQDGKLSLEEMLNTEKRKFVISSKFYDAGKNLHESQALHS